MVDGVCVNALLVAVPKQPHSTKRMRHAMPDVSTFPMRVYLLPVRYAGKKNQSTTFIETEMDGVMSVRIAYSNTWQTITNERGKSDMLGTKRL